MEIDIKDIKVGQRQRKDLGEDLDVSDDESLSSFVLSIKKFGVLQPLLINEDYELLCGERRLRAAALAGLTKVPVIMKSVNDPVIKTQVELEENIRRKPLTWQEKNKAIDAFHRGQVAIYGEKTAGASTIGWSSYDTAEELGISQGQVAMAKNISIALSLLPELANIKTQDDAFKKWNSVKKALFREKMAKEYLEAVRAGKMTEQDVYLGDCLDVMKQLEPSSVDIIATDPPFGVDIDKVKKTEGKHETIIYDKDLYEDTGKSYKGLMTDFLDLAMAVTKSDALFFICLGWSHYEFLVNELISRGLKVDRCPLIWIKPLGQVAHPDLHFGRCYEIVLFAIKGNRRIIKQGTPNLILNVKPVSPSDKAHPLEKAPMFWSNLLERVAQPGDIVLDPFAGTGSCLIAAKQLKCRAIGIEIDPYYHSIMNERLRKPLKDVGESDYTEEVSSNG